MQHSLPSQVQANKVLQDFDDSAELVEEGLVHTKPEDLSSVILEIVEIERFKRYFDDDS